MNINKKKEFHIILDIKRFLSPQANIFPILTNYLKIFF